MSKYKPVSFSETCGNCMYLDWSVVLTSYPEQARCTLFNKYVYVNSEKCLEDIEDNKNE